MIYDYIVIGSGFGGSVASLRLVEKGYKVLLLEQGKRYNPEDFPRTNWNIPKYLWIPSLRCFGFQKLSFYSTASILSGTGVGGGSLVYANTLYIPPDNFFNNLIANVFAVQEPASLMMFSYIVCLIFPVRSVNPLKRRVFYLLLSFLLIIKLLKNHK